MWEWCADGRRDYTADPVNDPVGGLAQVEPRVIRGGTWGDRARAVRCAVRYQGHAGYQGAYLGFRLVRVQSGS
ncbi:MAG: SUMF1/EgtB/PvdO family nonheme iron enzyme [Planctomycetota bacterium]|nr:SUMF1/EgtB/PvdO family nonheme iron enzyme [Planctomycetota bacterium]